MFRANIYSFEPLEAPVREELNNGIEMVAAYMGERVLSKELIVRAPTNSLGQVDPNRANFRKLDKMVELHMFALPLARPTHRPEDGPTRYGIAGIHSGWAYVDPLQASSPATLRTVAVHETAHALGFVHENASQQDPHSHGHCEDPACVMHKYVMPVVVPNPNFAWPKKSRLSLIKAMFKGTFNASRRPFTLTESQIDFCLECKVDIRHHAHHNLDELRVERLKPGGQV